MNGHATLAVRPSQLSGNVLTIIDGAIASAQADVEALERARAILERQQA